MSNTEYARPHTLRLSNAERADLARLTMAEIERLSCRPDSDRTALRRLRSLLDRLTD